MFCGRICVYIGPASWLEPQTRKLFKVCAMRHIPIFTFINKMDRETKAPLSLCEIVGGGGVVQIHLYGSSLLAPALGGEKEDAGLLPVVDPLELLAAAAPP